MQHQSKQKTATSFELSHAPSATEETYLIENNYQKSIDSSKNTPSMTKLNPSRWLLIFITVLGVTSVLLLLLLPQSIIDMIIKSNPPTNGMKKTLKIISQNNDESVFMKVNLPSHEIVYGETYSRYQSSTFELYPEDPNSNDEMQNIPVGSCFRIKSLNGKWLSVDYDNKVKATASSYFYAYSFSFHYLNSDSTLAKLKVCKKNRWLYMSLDSHHNLNTLVASNIPKDDDIESQMILESEATVFELSSVEHYKGVNFGGWFIPEVWMLSSFFDGTGLGWGGSLCAVRLLIVNLFSHIIIIFFQPII